MFPQMVDLESLWRKSRPLKKAQTTNCWSGTRSPAAAHGY
jgi:hypothetical protein